MAKPEHNTHPLNNAGSNLGELLASWKPGPLESAETINAWPVAAFSAMLELPAPAAVDGQALPPLWHWFHFLEALPQSKLGEDGHPASGHFMPPMPDRRRMIAGGRFEAHSPITVGKETLRRSQLGSVTVKSGRSGQMVFVTTRHHFIQDGRLILTEEQDVVYRSQPAGEQRPMPSPPVSLESEPEHRWRLATKTGNELLFRFSALTYNTHRIHYDQAYVTDIEGYPGLVVHGPMLALLLLEIPRRHHPHRFVRSFSYRLSHPTYSGATILTHGDQLDANSLSLTAMAAGGPISITGSAELR